MATITEALKKDIVHNADMLRSSQGDLGTIEGLANLKLALFHRLLTVPGTLIHRPQYGVGVSLFQNAPSSFAAQQRLAAIIEEQFKRDPRVEDVTSVNVLSEDGTPETTIIAVFVKPVGYDETEMIFRPFGGGSNP